MVRPLSIWGEKPLKSALTSLLKPMLNERDKLLISLTNEWSLIVGAEIAAYAWPQEIKVTKTDRILTLAVTPGMNTFVTHQEPELLEKIGQFIGPGKVTRIKVGTQQRA